MTLLRAFTSIAVVLLAGFAAKPAVAQTEDLTGPPLMRDLARIVERGRLIVAQVDQDLPPMFFKDEAGELSGLDIAIAQAMAQRLGVELEVLRTALSYDEVIAQVAAGEADLGISYLSRSALSAVHVLFSRSYATQGLTLLINRVKGLRFRDSCPSVEELLAFAELSGTLGVVAGSANAARVREADPDAQPREFESADDLLTAVSAGDVAISLQGEMVALQFLANNPATRIRLRACDIAGFQDQIGIAVPPGRYALLNWVNVFLDEEGILYNAPQIIAKRGNWQF